MSFRLRLWRQDDAARATISTGYKAIRPEVELLEERCLLAVSPVLVTGAAAGAAPRVTLLDAATGQEQMSFLAYAEAFRGGVRVAMGDVNGDGTQDIITAAGAGGGPHVRVFNGVTGAPLMGLMAYSTAFTGGVFVASGDVNGDGKDDIITGAGAGGGPHVRVFSGANGAELYSFLAYHPAFAGGVHVAAGDVNADGKDDIITGAGAGGGPHVRVFSGATANPLFGLMAYGPGFTGGVYVAAGDLNGDGRADIVTGAGAGGGPHVRAFNATTASPMGGFFAFDSTYLGGVPVSVVNGQVLVGGNPAGVAQAKAVTLSGTVVQQFNGLDADFRNGMFVAAGTRTVADDDAYEENDMRSQAANLGTVASPVSLNLHLLDDADWFRFHMGVDGTSPSYVRVDFQNSAGDIDLALYNSAGTLVRRSDSVSNVEQVSLNSLPAGDYFVRVFGYRGVHNPDYTLTIDPGPQDLEIDGGEEGDDGANVLYVNFDGAVMTSADLYRWAAGQWNPSRLPGGVTNGVTVDSFFAARSDREQIISGILANLSADLAPFGITVRRHTGLAVENVGATTLFAGRSTLTHPHVAGSVDFGNNNSTDIAFIGEENWGSAANIIRAMSDVFLHEAGHTYGLYHTEVEQNGVLYAESMGLRYSSTQDQWNRDTSFMDRTFIEFRDENGNWHGPGGGQSQNSYQIMRTNFGLTNSGNQATVDASQPGILLVSAASGADAIHIAQHASGLVDVTINGSVYTISGLQQLLIDTAGDERDQVQVTGNLTFQLTVGELGDAAFTKLDGNLTGYWNGSALSNEALGLGCCCPLCMGALDSALVAEDALIALSEAVEAISAEVSPAAGLTGSSPADEEANCVLTRTPMRAGGLLPSFSRIDRDSGWPDETETRYRSAEEILFALDELDELLTEAAELF